MNDEEDEGLDILLFLAAYLAAGNAAAWFAALLAAGNAAVP